MPELYEGEERRTAQAKTWAEKIVLPLLISTLMAVVGSAFKMYTDVALLRQELTDVHNALNVVSDKVGKQNEEFGRAIAILDDRSKRQHAGSEP